MPGELGVGEALLELLAERAEAGPKDHAHQGFDRRSGEEVGHEGVERGTGHEG